MKTLADFQKKLKDLEAQKAYNKSRIFKNAHYLKRNSFDSFQECLKIAWKKARQFREEYLKNEIEHTLNQIKKLYEIEVPLKLWIEMAEADMLKAHNRGIKIY